MKTAIGDYNPFELVMELAKQEARLLGSSFVRINADGSAERVPPLAIQVREPFLSKFTAIGIYLDRIGETVGYPRRLDEDDAAYRKRLLRDVRWVP